MTQVVHTDPRQTCPYPCPGIFASRRHLHQGFRSCSASCVYWKCTAQHAWGRWSASRGMRNRRHVDSVTGIRDVHAPIWWICIEPQFKGEKCDPRPNEFFASRLANILFLAGAVEKVETKLVDHKSWYEYNGTIELQWYFGRTERASLSIQLEKNGKVSKSTGRKAVHDLVYHEIRQSLMVGVFTPGEKVSLRSLARQVGTSLTPVREAVNRLIAEGALEVLPNRWVMIPVMTEEKFDEITHWRLQLEADATRRACDHVTRKTLREIKAINRRILKCMNDNGNRKGLLAINYEFHFAIYRTSRSVILLPMIESLWLQAGPFTYFSLESPRDLWNAKFHSAIIQALENGDREKAAQAVCEDILNTAEFLKGAGHYAQHRLRRVVP